ncbi:MAG: mannose-6-phosphate isomerase [Rhodospirillaceae bacterium]|jgi:mannose/cellobiose epimerase-like protein (N-acyl-D-glucosamine 2-epimerase family)|nr:mannose-6-phosphate isomerase [Rhodospirillaceae bacterium]MBT5943388.1 mannose-6-phosphate isomerase [Rhodospirillaceae bacterium]MBT6404150.1 mannose-6-phosphate isomerase [Rhodospirillaceae bacterium]MBT6537596.1 mannose-6-phosphate isomerase [Rhodospirillaceae bacterium]
MSIDADHIQAWLTQQALPLWSQAGFDAAADGFVECLTLDGQPLLDRDKRVRVQARQIYVYSHAHLLGWTPPDGGPSALDVAGSGFRFVTDNYWRADCGGFVYSAARDGTPADTRIEAYEQAFALFACAWYHRASGDPDALTWAKRTLAFLDENLADPAHGGYFENLPHDLPRRQNPHMHLLEALLALHGATADTAYLDRARVIVDLFRSRFLDGNTGTLGEFFEADWTPAPGTAGQTVEPGHHFEWAWLLRRYAEASGVDTGKEADALYQFAMTHGSDHAPGPAQGLAFDSVLRSGADPRLGHGTSLDDNKRLWVQTEAIKAQTARLESGPDDLASAHLEILLERLFGLYLAVEDGNWQDHLDANGHGFSQTAPASSFYHLFLCLTEVLRVRDRRTDLC